MKYFVIAMFCCLILLVGCGGKHFRVTPIIEEQPALHKGYNIGPDLYLEKGDLAKVTGAIVWIDGLDPNTLSEIND